MKTYNDLLTKYCIYTLIVVLCNTLLSCLMGSPQPIVVHLGGSWKWDKTYNRDSKIIEESSSVLFKSLRIDNINIDGNNGRVFRFYTNGVKTDSLFMYNSPTNPMEDKKDNTLYINAVDNEGNNAIIRSTFFFSKGKYDPDKMIINIQTNTDIYKASADTIQIEYLSDNL